MSSKPHPLREQGREMIKAGFRKGLVASILGVKPETVKGWRRRLSDEERAAIIPRRYVPTREAAKACQRTPGTMHSWSAQGRLPRYPIGGKIYICLDAALELSSAAARRSRQDKPRPVSKDGYVTISDAALMVSRSYSAMARWAREGLVTTKTRHGRMLVLLSSAEERAGKRAKHKARQEPPPPSVSLVPLRMGEETYQGWRIDGQELMEVGLLARILEYKVEKRLSAQIGHDWAEEFIEGEHFIMVEGLTLEVLKSELDTQKVSSPPNRTPRVKALTRAGVALVLLKTRKPLGVALRRAIADSHFMSELLDGNPEPFEQAKTGPAQDDRLLAVMEMMVKMQAESSRQHSELMAVLVQKRPPPPPPRPQQHRHDDPDGECVYMAAGVAAKLRREFPGRGISEACHVHALAKRCGIRGRDGRGVPGMSRLCNISNGYGYMVKYSTAAVDAMREILSMQAEMF